jgi:hypothetical protein
MREATEWVFNHFCANCKKHITNTCIRLHEQYSWCDAGDWGEAVVSPIHCFCCNRKTVRPYIMDDKKYCRECVDKIVNEQVNLIVPPHLHIIEMNTSAAWRNMLGR